MTTRRRWYRSWRTVIALSCFSALLMIYLIYGPDPDRAAVLVNMEEKLEEVLKLEKGLGCEIPELDPFALEVTMFDKNLPKIECFGIDWVKCYHSSCRVVDRIIETVNDIKCVYRDILYQTDQKYTLGPVTLSEDDSYELIASDHAEVSCNETRMFDYNIVGDGTLAALLPILTGSTELELADARKRNHGDSLDSYPFIFYKLKENGYRTAFFEDRSYVATSQFQFNGFIRQPADHYLRAFSMADAAKNKSRPYCVGGTPQFRLMINITEQFMKLDGKLFVFTLIKDVMMDVHRAREADQKAYSENRKSKFSDSVQGELEERLPLLALRLPSILTEERSGPITALRDNAHVLTTPHDLHVTILDVLGMMKHAHPFKEQGSELDRGLTMLEWIPRNRSCREAGVHPHWCSCQSWQAVPFTDPLCYKASRALIKFINALLATVGSRCVRRSLLSTEWVFRRQPNSHLSVPRSADENNFYSQLNADAGIDTENYKIKVIVGPGRAVFEASLTYALKEDQFYIRTSDISRTNAYGDEAECVRGTHPQLSYYCYCRH